MILSRNMVAKFTGLRLSETEIEAIWYHIALLSGVNSMNRHESGGPAVTCSLTDDYDFGVSEPIDMDRFRALNPELFEPKREYRKPAVKKPKNPVSVTSQPGYALYYRCKSRASRKGIGFELTIMDCAELAPCTYCGGSATGWDRVDSDLGYTRDNVVPACGTCNTMKMRMSTAEFLAHVRQILKFSGGEI